MKKTIVILIGSTVAISLIWPIDEILITQTSELKSAENQKKEESVQQDSANAQETKTKPKFKHPVYDLSKKSHWYNPETTIGLYESKTLSEWLEPFHPILEEFQIIDQYESLDKKLKESLSEDEYYSVEGRK